MGLSLEMVIYRHIKPLASTLPSQTFSYIMHVGAGEPWLHLTGAIIFANNPFNIKIYNLIWNFRHALFRPWCWLFLLQPYVQTVCITFLRANVRYRIMCLLCVKKTITPVWRPDPKPWPGQCCAPSLELEFIPTNTKPAPWPTMVNNNALIKCSRFIHLASHHNEF